MSELKHKIIERKGNYVKVKNRDVYRVKFGVFGEDWMIIGNTKKPLSEFIRGLI
tara:strand:+ start:2641 stop:2802 length:162 start_codon:yes stop_codon:yes gene_type:complete